MDKYTDNGHPEFIPGTFSIYSSAMLQHMRRLEIERSILMGSSTKEVAHLEYDPKYRYSYDPERPLDEIPTLKSRLGVVLWPQPTNSPNDPLNWSVTRKALLFILLLLFTGLSGALSNLASAPSDDINLRTGISYDALNDSAGVLFVGIALSTFLLGPLASLLGRKSVVIISLIFLLFGSIWYAELQKEGDIYGSQLLIGLGSGGSQAHVQLCLSSIFFRHQLGAVITIYNLSYALGTFLGPLCAKLEIESSSNFRWIGWSSAIAVGALLIMVVFCLEETQFDYTRFDSRFDDVTMNLSLFQYGIISESENKESITLGYNDKPLSYIERNLPFRLNREMSIKQFFYHYYKLLLLPVKCIWFPPILYAGLICGLQNALLTFYLTTEDTYLYDEPFLYDSTRVALMNIPCIIGSIIGSLYAGSITDYFVLWMARKHRGVIESEYRLWFAFLSGTIGGIGLLMFGIGVTKNLNWRVFYVGLGFIAYLFSSAMNLAMLYVLDTYQDLVIETLIGVAVINNIIGCIFTFACSPWLESIGTQRTYISLSVITLGIMYFALALIFWGKPLRRMTKHEYNRVLRMKKKYG